MYEESIWQNPCMLYGSLKSRPYLVPCSDMFFKMAFVIMNPLFLDGVRR